MISIRFLGTGGARFVVARQIRASGGIWLRFGETQIHVDPGPGALVRALSAVPPCEPPQLDAIVLSHKHLDHSGDVNVMIEAMCQGGWKRRGALLRAGRRARFRTGRAAVRPRLRPARSTVGRTQRTDCDQRRRGSNVDPASSLGRRNLRPPFSLCRKDGVVFAVHAVLSPNSSPTTARTSRTC